MLAGDEAKLVQEAVFGLCDAVLGAADDEESFFEVATVFDRMTRSQQLASLEAVAHHLFHKTPECLPLTAWSEATLATVLDEAKRLVRVEVDSGDQAGYRQTVLDAMGIDDWDDPEEWEAVLDCYDERFLWDLDYQDERGMDLPPDQEAATRAMMGVTNDYNAAIPPDLGAKETLQEGVKRVALAIDRGEL